MAIATTDNPVYAPAPIGNGATRKRGTAKPGGAGATALSVEPSTDEVNARFLQFLIPAAATLASTFGPQVGSAIGGLIGGSSGSHVGGQIGGSVGGLLGNLGGGLNLGGLFGGRSFVPADVNWSLGDHGFQDQHVDLTGPLVQQCTMECFGKITPDLSAMLKELQPQMKPAAGPSRSADVEIDALERFWPDIASFLTQQVASHLPGIIKTVTGAVMPMLGSRDIAQTTPMLTGTEANARWFLPVLSTVLTAVQQNLPNLLSVLGGESRAARDTSITWTDISVYGRFWDNDFIRVVAQQEIADKNSVEIVLELAAHLSWAKEIQVRDDNGALVARAHVQDSTKSAEVAVSADQILTNGSLLFAKAKAFGIMTGMYVLPTAGLDQLKGQRTIIRWMSD